MPFPSAALTSTQYDLLRGTSSVPSRYRCRAYVSVCPNNTVVACRVNGTPTGSSFISFSYDTVTSGAIADVKVRQTVLISRTNDQRAAYFIGRVKQLPTGSSSGTFYINETSAAVADNDYVWVINDYRIWPILARDDSGVQKKDYNISFAGDPPFVSGLQTIYAGLVDTTSGKLRIAFNITATASVSGDSISAYAWTFEGTHSVVSGSTSTASVTIDFDPTAGDWGHVVITDSGGRTLTRDFLVFAHDDDHLPSPYIDRVDLDHEVDSGVSGTMTVYDGFDSVLDGTLVCVWVDEKYNATLGSLLSGTNDKRNIAFVGRIRSETNQTTADIRDGLVSDTQLVLEDAAAQLRRLHGALIAEIIDASANEFDEIVNLTIWRGIIHLLGFHSTFLSLHDIAFDNTDNTFLCQGLRTQGENLFDVIADLAVSINAAMEFAPDGATRVIRNPYYKSTADRNALTTLANMTNQDWQSYTLTIDPALKVGQVRAEGGYYFNLGSINQVYPLLAIAPGVAQDYAEGKSTLTRQVLAANVDVASAKTEIKARIGRKFAEENISTNLSMNLMPGWRWLIPSRGYWITHTIAADTNTRGRAYTTSDRWMLSRVATNFDIASGTCSVTADFAPDINEDTIGASGDDLIYPEPDTTIAPELPALPPFDPYPIPDDIVPTDPPPIDGDPYNPTPPPKNGNTTVVWDDYHVWVTRNYLSTAPTWNDITPGTETIKACLYDPFPGATGLWVLESDGADSWVWYTSNASEQTPTWSRGDSVSGVYTQLRATDVQSGIMIYTPATETTPAVYTDYDFTLGRQGWTEYVSTLNGQNRAAYVAGQGWTYNDPAFQGEIQIYSPTFASVVITRVHIEVSATATGLRGQAYTGSSGSSPSAEQDFGTGSTSIDIDNPYGVTPITVAWVGIYIPGSETSPLTSKIRKVRLFTDNGATGGATMQYSTDNGATWGGEVSVGNTPGALGGFDTQRVGSASIGAADEQAYMATTKGGAYSTLGTDGATSGSDPTLILIPWGTWGTASVNNINTSTPDYLLGSLAAVSSHVLWRVPGGGSRTAITPTGATSMPSANCATTYLGTKAAVIASVSGTRHLFTSTNIGSSDTWTDRGALGSNADFIRPLRLSTSLQQLFWVDGTNAKFSANFGATIVSKPTPSSGTLRGIEVYG